MTAAVTDMSAETIDTLLKQADQEGMTSEVAAALEERENLGMCLFAPVAGQTPTFLLEEMLVQMNVLASTPSSASTSLYARTQAAVVEAELQRREEFYALVRSGHWFSPTRNSLRAALAMYGRRLEEAPGSDEFLREWVSLYRSMPESSTPSTVVSDLMREVVNLPSPSPDASLLTAWLQWAITLDILAQPMGLRRFTGLSIPTPLASAAARVHSLFFGTSRHDPLLSPNPIMDIPGDLASVLVEESVFTEQSWAQMALPLTEKQLFLRPSEGGAVAPGAAHPQVRPRVEAKKWAESAGGVIFPMLFPVLEPQQRKLLSRSVWTSGLPEPPSHLPGLTLYGRPDDRQVSWETGLHPAGFLCAVFVSPSRLLRVGLEESREEEKLLLDLMESAERQRTTGREPYGRILRRLLKEEGIDAIARYDFVNHETPRPQELIIPEPSAERVCVIRESLPPSFVQTQGPLRAAG